MKDGKVIFLSTVVILGAAGMIFGNHVLTTGIFAAGDTLEQAIVIPEEISADAAELSSIGIHNDANGVVYLAASNPSENMQKSEDLQMTDNLDLPVANQDLANGVLSEEEAKQIGINAIVEKFGLTQEEIDLFNVSVSIRYPIQDSADMDKNTKDTLAGHERKSDTQTSPDTDVFLWSVRLTPFKQSDFPTIDFYSASFDNRQEELMLVNAIPLIREGTPLANEITSDKAQELAIAALVQKYALTQKTLAKFTVTTKYYEVTDEAPGKHVWWVNLYPTNTDEYSEIGCYWSYIDAETGEVLQLNSAVNGKG